MFKIKFKFIYLAFFTCLLFLFVNGNDNNKKTTKSYNNNDYEVHFVVHKIKKPKKENFLERKKKRIQKWVNKRTEKNTSGKRNKARKWLIIGLLTLLGALLIVLILNWMGIIIFNSGKIWFATILTILLPGSSPNFGASAGGGAGAVLLFILLVLTIFLIANRALKKEKNPND